MPVAEPKPLDRAKAHINEAMQIAIDFTKIASQMHPADKVLPASELIEKLLESADCIDRLQEGVGRRMEYAGFTDVE